MATYTVKKRLVSVGRDYQVHDESGATAFEVDGKVRFARTFDIKDPAGAILYSAKEKLMTVDQTFLIDVPSGGELAVRRITTAAIYPMKFDVSADGESRFQAHGSFFRDGVEITRGSTRVANIGREPNTAVMEIFHLWVADGEDAALMLAIAMVCVEGDPSRGSSAPVSSTP